jgi:two-component system NtrC family sensor kinase
VKHIAHETILVVDDSPEIMCFLERILTPLGYNVIGATDGQSGLDTSIAHTPDLIMLDMKMPRMTGLEMLTALRQTGCQTPVIFMTVHGSENIAVEAFRLGVRDYLTKPFAIEEVQQAVDHALQEARLRREEEELAHNLVAAETVRQTVVTLAHHINNHLTALSGNLTLLQETLARIVQDSHASLTQIETVLRVLQQITEVQHTPYHDQIYMIDIETALHEELAQNIDSNPEQASDSKTNRRPC